MQHKIKILFAALLAIGCQKHPKAKDPEPVTPPVSELYAAAVERLGGFLDHGWIVSRGKAGEAVHQGDSLLWSGLWLASAGCDQAGETELALQDMIKNHGGALVRFHDESQVTPVTVDGALGLYRGAAERIKRCPDSAPAWSTVLDLHRAYVTEHEGSLNVESDARIGPFDYLLDSLVDRAAGRTVDDSGSDSYRGFALVTAAWPSAIRAQYVAWKAGQARCPAAYPVHLSLIAFQTAEVLGVSTPAPYRDAACNASAGFDMPTMDAWCGRLDLAYWIDAFEYDRWEYRHQRAGLFETEDGNGYQTPAIDLLKAIRERYIL